MLTVLTDFMYNFTSFVEYSDVYKILLDNCCMSVMEKNQLKTAFIRRNRLFPEKRENHIYIFIYIWILINEYS